MAAVHERMLQAADGTPLFAIDWPADASVPARGGIVLMHGLGEHCSRYAHFDDVRAWLVTHEWSALKETVAQ